jgi:hypothetical protein
MSQPLAATPESLLEERYRLDDQAPNNEVYGPLLRYGVIDRRSGQYAMLPDATLCWGLTIDRALDALNELRGGRMAERSD